MAVGDLVGDLATAYLTPAQRAAQARGVQSLTGGPIARASSQLPVAAGLASPAPTSAATPDAPAPTSAAGQPLAQAIQPQLLESLAPAVTASTVTAPSATDLGQISLATLAPPSTMTTSSANTATDQPQGLDAAFRPTGIGSGASAIAGRVGAGGVPEFTNQPADLASAAARPAAPIAAQLPNSLDQLAPTAGATPDPLAELSGLGSAANLGDGMGTFSQGKTGDSALAMSRFQRANDLRQGYKDQDRLNNALAANTRANNTNVVRDSSRPITRSDVYRDQQDQQESQGRLANIANAQAAITGRQQTRGAEQTLQRNARIEDILAAGQGAGATPEQRAAAQRVLDPTGKNAFAQQQAQAQLTNTQLEGQLKQQDLAQKAQANQQASQDRVRAQTGQVATIDQALASVDSLLGSKVDPKNPSGKRLDEDPGLEGAVGFSSVFPTVPGSKSADFEAKLDTLKAQSFLPQVALLKGAGALSDAEGKKLSDSIGALSPKMSEEAFRKSLNEIRTTFSASRDRLGASSAPAQTGTARIAPTASIPTVTSKAQADALPTGSIFIGPDGKQYRK